EQGFNSGPLSWLTPSFGTVESLVPIQAAPINLHEEMCGPHRKRPAAEEEERETDLTNPAADSPFTVFLSSLRPQAKGASLLQSESTLGEPVVVFTGPPRGQGVQQGATLASSDAKPAKLGSKVAAPKPGPSVPAGSAGGAPPVATASAVPWTSFSPASLAASPPPGLGAAAPAPVPIPRARPKLVDDKPQ